MKHRHAPAALAAVLLTLPLAALSAAPSQAASSRARGEFGHLFLDGAVVRTLGTPAALPNGGSDLIYAFSSGAAGQLAVTAVGPGTGDFHGGAWAVHVVTWTAGVTPYLITSDEAVDAAVAAGDVTVTRNEAADFRCPVLP